MTCLEPARANGTTRCYPKASPYHTLDAFQHETITPPTPFLRVPIRSAPPLVMCLDALTGGINTCLDPDNADYRCFLPPGVKIL